MKVAVTGHTSGIGKAIYEKYQPNSVGFSRSNGFDITKDIKKILKACKDCDIFVNNAQQDFFQTFKEKLSTLALCLKTGLKVIVKCTNTVLKKSHLMKPMINCFGKESTPVLLIQVMWILQ
jgi:NADP-dependent 3-hydroxy acid dehydrogenase YdfG